MQSILIRPHESGTIIPKCGLDKTTDKLRKLFRLSLSDFLSSFCNPASPSRWLYFLLSNQQLIVAKLYTLEMHVLKTKEYCKKQKIYLYTELQDNPEGGSSVNGANIQTRIDSIDELQLSLNSILTRLTAPKEQLEQLKGHRSNKIDQFSKNYLELRRELAAAFLAGGLHVASDAMLDKAMAYFFSFQQSQHSPLKKQDHSKIFEKIHSAVTPNIPEELQAKILTILVSTSFWSTVGCPPSLPIAMELTPVLIKLLREFDRFRVNHGGLVVGIERLKANIKMCEQQYAQCVMHSKVDGVFDETVKALLIKKAKSATSKKQPRI